MSQPAHLNSANCHCESLKIVDSITAKECLSVSRYFSTLARFADKRIELSNSDLSGLIQAGTYGGVTVTSTETSVANGITEGLTGLWATSYKNKKMKRFVQLYREYIAPLISFLSIRANSLSARIVNLNLSLDRIADSLMATTHTAEGRWTIVYVHDLKKTELEHKYQQSIAIESFTERKGRRRFDGSK